MYIEQRYIKNAEVKEKIYSMRIAEDLHTLLLAKAKDMKISVNLYLNLLLTEALTEQSTEVENVGSN